MKLSICAFLLSATLTTFVFALVDFPYVCTETEICDDSCDPGAVTCTLASTLPYETICDNIVVSKKSVRCIVKRKSDREVVGDSTVVKCTGCDSGGTGTGCEPGSGAWWVGCDPFAN